MIGFLSLELCCLGSKNNKNNTDNKHFWSYDLSSHCQADCWQVIFHNSCVVVRHSANSVPLTNGNTVPPSEHVVRSILAAEYLTPPPKKKTSRIIRNFVQRDAPSSVGKTHSNQCRSLSLSHVIKNNNLPKHSLSKSAHIFFLDPKLSKRLYNQFRIG
jgi:hypothetical protein